MHRPLNNIPAIVLCPGPDLPADKLGAFDGYFTIGVNKLWGIRPDYHPTVAFWIDPESPIDNPEWHEYSLCICDSSSVITGLRTHTIGLPMRGCASLPQYAKLDNQRLYHRPSAGVVAALWAVSLGCWPVCGLGMGCEADGRNEHQLAAMRDAMADLHIAHYIPDGRWRPSFWQWTREAVEHPVVWASYLTSPRMRDPGPGGEAVKAILQQFYSGE